MDERKTHLLAQLPHDVRSALHVAAVAAGVTVDDVVRAQLGRAPVPEGAIKALDGLRARNISVDDATFKRALVDWPYDCSECGQSFAPSARPRQCARVGCVVSLDGGAFAREHAAQSEQRAERKALGESLAAQAIAEPQQPLPEPVVGPRGRRLARGQRARLRLQELPPHVQRFAQAARLLL